MNETLAGVFLEASTLLRGFDRTTLTMLVSPQSCSMMRHYGLAMMFFAPAILLMSQLASPIGRHLLVTESRTKTLIGASTGMTFAVFVREPQVRPIVATGPRRGSNKVA